MANSVFCIAKTDADAIRIIQRLRSSAIPDSDISVLGQDAASQRDLNVANSTEAPEGAATGATTGAVFGGALGWAAGIGALAIPGIGALSSIEPVCESQQRPSCWCHNSKPFT